MKRVDMDMCKILLIDDDPEFTAALEQILVDEDQEVLVCAGAEDVEEIDYQPDLVLMDWWFGDETGEKLGKRVVERWRGVPLVVMSSDKEVPWLAKNVKTADFLIKPFKIGELLKVVERYTN